MSDKTTEIFKAMADETRLGLIRKLAEASGPITSCDLVSSCASLGNLSQPTVSHHFSKLVDAGILTEDKVGVQKTYELNRHLLISVGIDANKI